MTVASDTPRLRKGDWIRFQIKASRIVLEGFVQELAPDGSRIRVGKAVDSPENEWHALNDITIVKQQRR